MKRPLGGSRGASALRIRGRNRRFQGVAPTPMRLQPVAGGGPDRPIAEPVDPSIRFRLREVVQSKRRERLLFCQ
jgi:hypothetical protein